MPIDDGRNYITPFSTVVTGVLTCFYRRFFAVAHDRVVSDLRPSTTSAPTVELGAGMLSVI